MTSTGPIGPWSAVGAPPRARRLPVGLVVALWAGFALAVATWVLSAAGEPVPLPVKGAVSLLGTVLPAAACWWALARSTSPGGPARLAVLAVTAFAVGTVWNAVAVLVTGSLPVPSPGDLGFAAFYAVIALALVTMVRPLLAELRIRAGLDLTASLLTVLALLSVPLDPLVHEAAAGQLSAGTALAVLYPVLDLLVITVLGAVALFGGGHAIPGWPWLIAGLVVFLVSDVEFALGAMDLHSLTTSLVQVGWLAGLALVAMWAVTLVTTPRTEVSEPVLRTRGQYSEMVAALTAASVTVAGLVFVVVGKQVDLSVPTRVLGGLAIVFYGARGQLAFWEVRRGSTLMRLAHTDDLTELPNRRALYAFADERLTPGAPEAALLLMDLDRFKEVNDSLGHHLGDRLLIQASRRLRSCLPDDAQLARLGGDEFAVLMTADDPAPALAVADRIRVALSRPFVLDDLSVEVTVSIGVAMFPEHGEALASLLRRADIAMYKAKASGSRVHLFTPEHDTAATQRLGRVAQVRSALERGQIVPWYQPKLDLRRGRVTGVEALVRWQHPTEGVLPPSAFLELVESTGLMHQLTCSVMEQALDQVVAWRQEGVDLTVAVNLSASSLIDPSVPDHVFGLLAQRRLEPSVLELEITEGLLMADRHQARAILTELRNGGVRIAIDDFGSGYSSLAYLRDLPIDELKIDRAFVDPLIRDPRAQALVAAVITLAHGLGQVAVAEGAEDEETVRRLAELGCDLVQGYVVARPMRGSQLPTWLAEHSFQDLSGHRV